MDMNRTVYAAGYAIPPGGVGDPDARVTPRDVDRLIAEGRLPAHLRAEALQSSRREVMGLLLSRAPAGYYGAEAVEEEEALGAAEVDELIAAGRLQGRLRSLAVGSTRSYVEGLMRRPPAPSTDSRKVMGRAEMEQRVASLERGATRTPPAEAPRQSARPAQSARELIARADFQAWCGKGGRDPEQYAAAWMRRYPHIRWSAE